MVDRSEGRQALDAAWRAVSTVRPNVGEPRLHLESAGQVEAFSALAIASALEALAQSAQRCAEALEVIAEQGPGK